MSAASYRAVMSTLRKCQEYRIVLNFFVSETHFYAKIQVQFLNQGLTRIVSTRGEQVIGEVTILFLASEF